MTNKAFERSGRNTRLVFFSLITALVFSGCASVGPTTGPRVGTVGGDQKETSKSGSVALLDVLIPVLDPGLPEDPDDYEREGVWPELRRAESRRMALYLRDSITATNRFGAVRIAPIAEASSDVYVQGVILKSNGEDLRLRIEVNDSTGKTWYRKKYTHRVKEAWFTDLRNKGKDSFQSLYDDIAEDLAEYFRKSINSKRQKTIKNTTIIRIAQNFSPESFSQFAKVKNSRVTLLGVPADDDPMFQAIKQISLRDKMFVDSFQDHYEAFSEEMNESYVVWQEQSYGESKAQRKLKEKAAAQAILGILLIGASAAVADTSSAAAVIGATGGAVALLASFQTSKETKVHRDILNQLGRSIDVAVAPKVVEFEGHTETLTGTADEQYAKWRALLREIYATESTPIME